jgi:iron complex outermembrane recepter protein
VKEICSDAITTNEPGCNNNEVYHSLKAITYNDAQVAWNNAFWQKNFTVEAGVINLFGVNPPICFTCTLNGYDAGTYDLPGAFWNVRMKYKF